MSTKHLQIVTSNWWMKTALTEAKISTFPQLSTLSNLHHQWNTALCVATSQQKIAIFDLCTLKTEVFVWPWNLLCCSKPKANRLYTGQQQAITPLWRTRTAKSKWTALEESVSRDETPCDATCDLCCTWEWNAAAWETWSERIGLRLMLGCS